MSVGINQGPHVFALQGLSQVTRFEAIDHPNRAPMVGVLHHLQDRSFDDYILEVERFELRH